MGSIHNHILRNGRPLSETLIKVQNPLRYGWEKKQVFHQQLLMHSQLVLWSNPYHVI